jgi:hypothetical protein
MKDKSKVNIEYAHVYAGTREIDREIGRGTSRVETYVSSEVSSRDHLSLSVLIDDYSSQAGSPMELAETIALVMELEPVPTHVVLESSLVGAAEEVLKLIDDTWLLRTESSLSLRVRASDIKLSRDEEWYEDSLSLLLGSLDKGRADDDPASPELADAREDLVLSRSDSGGGARYTCAALTAAWHLCRLGLVDLDERLFVHSSPQIPFAGHTLLTVLPTRYLTLESAALTIIGSLRGKRFKKARQRMEYVFHGAHEE